MKALLLVLLALWVVHAVMHPKARTPQRISNWDQAVKAGDWFVIHPNGGGI